MTPLETSTVVTRREKYVLIFVGFRSVFRIKGLEEQVSLVTPQSSAT